MRWLKDGRLLNEDNVHISSDGANHNLTINPLKLSNAGVYVCDANTDEMSFTVIVKGKKLETTCVSDLLLPWKIKLLQTSICTAPELHRYSATDDSKIALPLLLLHRNEGNVYPSSGEHEGTEGQHAYVTL